LRSALLGLRLRDEILGHARFAALKQDLHDLPLPTAEGILGSGGSHGVLDFQHGRSIGHRCAPNLRPAARAPAAAY
jgi:hypothetical protein